MLATLIAKLFNRPEWINEEEYDGFQAMVAGQSAVCQESW